MITEAGFLTTRHKTNHNHSVVTLCTQEGADNLMTD